MNECTSNVYKKTSWIKNPFPSWKLISFFIRIHTFVVRHALNSRVHGKSQHGFKSFAASRIWKQSLNKKINKIKKDAAADDEFNLSPHGVCDVLSTGIDSYSLWTSKQPKRDSRMLSTLFWMESTCSAGQYSSKLDLTRTNVSLIKLHIFLVFKTDIYWWNV